MWQGRTMAWEDDLFALLDDLEQQADALYDAERAPELADRSRAEYQQVTLASRLMASVGREVGLEVAGVGAVAGVLERVADGWCLVRGADQDWVVTMTAVRSVSGASDRAVPEVAWSPLARLGRASVLRRLAEAGERCVLHDTAGGRVDGIPRRVGADFVEVAVGEDARVVLVAFATLAAVQSRD
ncbi:hypothetical protein SAMN05421872_101630 [Nocardioides lianchengensis]|uniref:Uncharacterized protein n=2 Tax=Nocardioides lianchengensis TaxID=1045774 RepID=A0A1G6JZF6_9ACTN|nr:hypothetical protein SAMN05421872_101630 [Nocardioides lianchengensis]